MIFFGRKEPSLAPPVIVGVSVLCQHYLFIYLLNGPEHFKRIHNKLSFSMRALFCPRVRIERAVICAFWGMPSRHPLRNYPSVHRARRATPQSAEEILGGQRQKVDFCFVCLFPRSGELRTQKLKSHLVRTENLNVLHLKPKVGEFITMHATLTAR